MTPEEIFKKNFNEGMKGVHLKMTTYEKFTKTHPSLLKVILKSMVDFKLHR